MRVMFMGTPEISARCLDAIVASSHTVVSVVTGKDKPRGRGNIMTPTPTKASAIRYGIDVNTPDTLRTDEFMDYLKGVNPDIIVVVAYGKILPKAVLDFPRYGCINLHVSLLPKYRGAAPMQRAIMEGESETGVTVMHMAEGLDTGDIISSERFPIGPTDDFEAIHDRSCEVGAPLLVKTLDELARGTATRTPQDDTLSSYAAKIEKTDAKIDFTKSARALDYIIRGTTPIPGAYAYLKGKMLKIYGALPVESNKGTPGEVIALDAKGQGSFTVACGEGALKVTGVIPEGKGRMCAGDFIRGRKIEIGDLLE